VPASIPAWKDHPGGKNLGVGVRAFEVTADYVQNYVQGGRILIKHQAVALRLCRHGDTHRATRAL
jgi:alkylation response protein AidB-like acyl-CoA dehydrogenase